MLDECKELERGEEAEDICKEMMMIGPEPKLDKDRNATRWAVKRQQAPRLSGVGQGECAEIEVMGKISCSYQQSGK